MNRNKMMKKFETFLLVIGIGGLLWAIIKAILMGFDIWYFANSTLGIFVTAVIGVLLLWHSISNLIKLRKGQEIKHGFDERTASVVSKSLRNAGVAVVIAVYGFVYVASLFYEPDLPVLSLNQAAWSIYIGIAVWFVSVFSYRH
ncbi:hypothetical protein KY328_01385 [Candidatus Woesearchaeota archaeon]|nr:hypothetical protein [Candidatus Woesearchaeota archaeon]MBW3021549.1 hypothetical protein [Candidatus Woesearchaeota archaeon]